MKPHRDHSELEPNNDHKKKSTPTQAYSSRKKQHYQLFSSGLKITKKHPHKETLFRLTSHSCFFTSIGLLRKAFLSAPQTQIISHLPRCIYEQDQDLRDFSLQRNQKKNHLKNNQMISREKGMSIGSEKKRAPQALTRITSEHEINLINRRNYSAGRTSLKGGRQFSQIWDNHSERKPNKMGKQLISCVLDGPYSHGLSLKMEF